MRIKDWPENERPREKLLQRGAGALSDAELLAIFLRTGCAGVSAVDLARQLLSHFGGLQALCRASEAEFCAVRGMGQAKYVQFQAVMELAQRRLAEALERGDSFHSPRDVSDYLRLHLSHLPQEVFLVLFLDTRHRLLAREELFRGTIDAAAVYPREVLKRALHHNAAAVILAHNHPSGVAEPSQADVRLTEQLRAALALVDVRLLDHMVVGSGEPVSMADRGLL